MKTIGVIGGGASGICFAYNVSKYLPACEVKLIEAKGLAEGPAFGIGSDERILNVAAQSMSIDCFEPQHFIQWLTSNGYQQNDFRHWPFVSRNLYRQYLLACWNNTETKLIKSRATKVLKIKDKISIRLASDSEVLVDYLILATGYDQSPKLFNHPQVIDCLALDARDIRNDERILVVGSALSAFDVFQIIKERPLKKCDFLSRRGQIPLPHLAEVEKLDLAALKTLPLAEIVKEFRRLKNSHSWQAIADAFKGHIEYVWPLLSEKEKSQFRRLLKPYWSAIRHRLPEGVLYEFAQDARFQLLAGKMMSISKSGDGLSVRIRSKGEMIESVYDKIIQATGQSISNQFRGLEQLEKQVLRLGPALHYDFWETNSIPNIREQILRFLLLQRGSIH